jgi:hypothetical protein
MAKSFFHSIDGTFGRIGLTSPHRVVTAVGGISGALIGRSKGKGAGLSSFIAVVAIGEIALLAFPLVFPAIQHGIVVPLFFTKKGEDEEVAIYEPRPFTQGLTKILNQNYGAASLGAQPDGKVAIAVNPDHRPSKAWWKDTVAHEKVHAAQGLMEPFDPFYMFNPRIRAFLELEAYALSYYSKKPLSESYLRTIYRKHVADTIYGHLVEYEDEAVKWVLTRKYGTARTVKQLNWMSRNEFLIMSSSIEINP